MRDKHIALVKELLKQPDKVTAKQLSVILNISERSVRNYVNQINYFEKDLIDSKRGYSIQKERARLLLQQNKTELPQTPAERVNYIITELLKKDSEGQQRIDLYELSEQKMFVSYETVKKDMIKVNKRLKEFNLYAVLTNSSVSIEGKELNKRKLLSSILFEAFNQNVLSLSIVQKAFPDYDLELLQKIIKEQCKHYHYFINDYAMLNLVLDIVISMDRIRKNCTFYTHTPEKRYYGVREAELSRRIAKEIEKSFNIEYSGVELEELTVMLIGHLMKVDFDTLNQHNVVQMVGTECIDLVKKLLDYLNENYYINSENEDFIIKFTMHISNLLTRLKYNYTIKNPLTNHIKNSCPLIFECSVGIANQIEKLTGNRVNEDEIAYIALHIGGNLETYEADKNKISCICLFPQYYDFTDKVIEKLQEKFSQSIVIKEVAASEKELMPMKPEELLITTVQVEHVAGRKEVLVNPFLSDRDISAIRENIDTIKLEKKKVRLRELLVQISDATLFGKNLNFPNREEAICHMVKSMEQKQYVEREFIDEVFEREHHSSTAFGCIAVPHSLRMNAKKTGVFILLNDKPIPWDNQSCGVNIVLMFAIARSDRAIFHEVFDNLVVLLLENLNSSRVLRCNTYDEFIDVIIDCIG